MIFKEENDSQQWKNNSYSSSRVQMNTYVWLLKLIQIPASESSSTHDETREDEDTFFEKKTDVPAKKTKSHSMKVTTQEVRFSEDKRFRWKCLELA